MEENVFEGYEQFTVPDTGSLSAILEKLKGPNRNMGQYAEECGEISAATLSRIANGKISRPLPKKSIEILYSHRDESSEVSMDALLRANGMIKKTEFDNYKRLAKEKANDPILGGVRSTLMPSILINELFKRGILIRKLKYPENISFIEEETSLTINYTLTLELPEAEGGIQWGFLPYSKIIEDNEEWRIMNRVETAMSLWYPFFIADAWYPEKLAGLKTSCVVADKKIFDKICNILSKVKIHSYFSLILVNYEEGIVEKEFILNGNSRNSLFELPYIQ